jgi:mono/diheme cytochrome c family protein
MEMRRWCAAGVPVLVLTLGLGAGTGALGAATKKKAPAKRPAAKGNAAMLAKGKQFVEADGCLACHKLGAKGNAVGPELTKIGAKDPASEIAAKIKNPKHDKPDSTMPPSRRPDKEIAAMAAYLASLK